MYVHVSPPFISNYSNVGAYTYTYCTYMTYISPTNTLQCKYTVSTICTDTKHVIRSLIETSNQMVPTKYNAGMHSIFTSDVLHCIHFRRCKDISDNVSTCSDL